MYMCICNAVTESQITKAIEEGVTTWKGLCRKMGVATQCGICAKGAKEYFDRELARKKREAEEKKEEGK